MCAISLEDEHWQNIAFTFIGRMLHTAVRYFTGSPKDQKRIYVTWLKILRYALNPKGIGVGFGGKLARAMVRQYARATIKGNGEAEYTLLFCVLSRCCALA